MIWKHIGLKERDLETYSRNNKKINYIKSCKYGIDA